MAARKNTYVKATVIITIIIVTAYGAMTIANLQSSPGPVDAIITVENKISRVGDGVLLDAGNSSGEIKEYLWDFGDGNTSTNVSEVHYYEVPGWYTVSLTVYGRDGQRSNATAVVGIQQEDYVIDRNLDRNVWLFTGRFGTGALLEAGPNIGNPTIELTIHLEGAVGNLGCSLHLDGDVFFQETFLATGGDLDYSIPNDINSCVSIRVIGCPSNEET